jgi:hypothetical protein
MDTKNPYEGRRAHWIRPNETERFPHRWIVADTEGRAEYVKGAEIQTLRCVDAVRWRDDLKTGEHEEWIAGESAPDFWAWVDDYCRAGHRTVLWAHNISYDLRTLDAFRQLPLLGWALEWCNLSRDVSVVSWRSDHGTLVIADTYTWCPKPLADLSGMVGIGKPRLPQNGNGLETWHARCKADVEITRQVVRELLAFVKAQHMGNWQPSGAGMGYASWRHRFLTSKVLVHDDAPALAAEREAMHTGRAEAWHHGKASGGPFTEWDMNMSYPRIAAECDVPVKLFAYDDHPSKEVHKWAMKHWTVLARVTVRTDKPVVPCTNDGRIIWPVGEFDTVLWQPELELITLTGGSYTVHEQWRYNAAPALREWAEWSIGMVESPPDSITPVQRTFVKHQARAVIGRLGLKHSVWQDWGANPFGWCGVTDYLDGDTGQTARMLHVGDKTMLETERREADSSLPQITGYIMSEARVRLWCAAEVADPDHVLHVDTDGMIVDRVGNANMEALANVQLRGAWRQKERWGRLDVTGPRHYRATGRRVIPGVPVSASEIEPGVFKGQVWQSLSAALECGNSNSVHIMERTWRPKVFDGRRPWAGDGPAAPIVLTGPDTERAQEDGNDESGQRDGASAAAVSHRGRMHSEGQRTVRKAGDQLDTGRQLRTDRRKRQVRRSPGRGLPKAAGADGASKHGADHHGSTRIERTQHDHQRPGTRERTS